MLSGKDKKEKLLVFDPSFISKSGKHTYGLARYRNGKAQRAEKGLEDRLSGSHRCSGKHRLSSAGKANQAG